MNISTGKGSDRVILADSANDAVVNLGAGRDYVMSNEKYAEMLNGGAGRDTFILFSPTAASTSDTVRGGGGRDQFVLLAPDTNHKVADIRGFKSGKDKIIILDDDTYGEPIHFSFDDAKLPSSGPHLTYLAGSGLLVAGTQTTHSVVLDFGGPLAPEVGGFSVARKALSSTFCYRRQGRADHHLCRPCRFWGGRRRAYIRTRRDIGS